MHLNHQWDLWTMLWGQPKVGGLPFSGFLRLILELTQHLTFSCVCASLGWAGAQRLWNVVRIRQSDLCYESWQAWWVHFPCYNFTYAVQAPASYDGASGSATRCSILRSYHSVGSVLGTCSITSSSWGTLAFSYCLTHFSFVKFGFGLCPLASTLSPLQGCEAGPDFWLGPVQVPTSLSLPLKLNVLEENVLLLMDCSDSVILFTSST